jgi:hypothetical protein
MKEIKTTQVRDICPHCSSFNLTERMEQVGSFDDKLIKDRYCLDCDTEFTEWYTYENTTHTLKGPTPMVNQTTIFNIFNSANFLKKDGNLYTPLKDPRLW